jgi:hypothetical protein
MVLKKKQGIFWDSQNEARYILRDSKQKEQDVFSQCENANYSFILLATNVA